MSIRRNAATIRTMVGIACMAESQVASTPAIRAPRMGGAGRGRARRRGERGRGRAEHAPVACGSGWRPWRRCSRSWPRRSGRGRGGRGLGTIARGDDVLGDAAEEQRADEVEPGVEVQVGGDGGEEDESEADRGLDRRDMLPATPIAAWIRCTIAYCGCAKKGSTCARRPIVRSLPASMFAARRSASVPDPRPSKEQSSRITSMRPAESTGGDYPGPASIVRCYAGVRNWNTAPAQNRRPFGACGFGPTSGTWFTLAPCAGGTRSPCRSAAASVSVRSCELVEIGQPPRYNIAPTDPVLAIRVDERGERDTGILRWG